MDIELINQGSARILKLNGRLDTLTAPQLDAQTEKLYGVNDDMILPTWRTSPRRACGCC